MGHRKWSFIIEHISIQSTLKYKETELAKSKFHTVARYKTEAGTALQAL